MKILGKVYFNEILSDDDVELINSYIKKPFIKEKEKILYGLFEKEVNSHIIEKNPYLCVDKIFLNVNKKNIEINNSDDDFSVKYLSNSNTTENKHLIILEVFSFINEFFLKSDSLLKKYDKNIKIKDNGLHGNLYFKADILDKNYLRKIEINNNEFKLYKGSYNFKIEDKKIKNRFFNFNDDTYEKLKDKKDENYNQDFLIKINKLYNNLDIKEVKENAIWDNNYESLVYFHKEIEDYFTRRENSQKIENKIKVKNEKVNKI